MRDGREHGGLYYRQRRGTIPVTLPEDGSIGGSTPRAGSEPSTKLISWSSAVAKHTSYADVWFTDRLSEGMTFDEFVISYQLCKGPRRLKVPSGAKVSLLFYALRGAARAVFPLRRYGNLWGKSERTELLTIHYLLLTSIKLLLAWKTSFVRRSLDNACDQSFWQ